MIRALVVLAVVCSSGAVAHAQATAGDAPAAGASAGYSPFRDRGGGALLSPRLTPTDVRDTIEGAMGDAERCLELHLAEGQRGDLRARVTVERNGAVDVTVLSYRVDGAEPAADAPDPRPCVRATFLRRILAAAVQRRIPRRLVQTVRVRARRDAAAPRLEAQSLQDALGASEPAIATCVREALGDVAALVVVEVEIDPARTATATVGHLAPDDPAARACIVRVTTEDATALAARSAPPASTIRVSHRVEIER